MSKSLLHGRWYPPLAWLIVGKNLEGWSDELVVFDLIEAHPGE